MDNQAFIIFDPHNLSLYSDKNRVGLSGNMCSCLELLMAKQGEVVTKDQIFEACWGSKGVMVSEASIRQVVTHLRKKIQQLDAANNYIITLPRRGYILKTGVIRYIAHPVDCPVPETAGASGSLLTRLKQRLSCSYAMLSATAIVLMLIACFIVFKFSRAPVRGGNPEKLIEYVTGMPVHDPHFPTNSFISVYSVNPAPIHHYYSYLSYLEGQLIHTLVCDDEIALSADSCKTLLLFR